MNIWIVTAYDPVPGLDQDIRRLRYGTLAELLEANGHHIVFWTSAFAHWRKKLRFPKGTTVRLRESFVAEFLSAPPYSRNVSLRRIWHNRAIARDFRQRTAEHARPDAIFAVIPCLELAEAAAVYASGHGIPFICDIEDIWPEVYISCLPNYLHNVAKALLISEYRRLKRILQASVAITAVSESYLKWAARRIETQPRIADRAFPLGYDRPTASVQEAADQRQSHFLEAHGLTAETIVITFLGQFGTSYDVITIVEAARLLAHDSTLPPYRFVLAGAGSKDSEMRRRARNLDSVTFTGWLDNVDSICLLKSSAIALAAYSKTAAQSLPYKPFEYMAYGLPIVNSLRGELACLIEKAEIGANYAAGSAGSLAICVRDMLRNPSRRAASGIRARALFDTSFDASVIYRGMTRHLVDVVGAADKADLNRAMPRRGGVAHFEIDEPQSS